MAEQALTYNTFISQIGNSQGVRIPKILLEREQLGFSPENKTSVVLISTGDGILIKPLKRKERVTLDELLTTWNTPYETSDEIRAWEQMPPVGRELL
jgi:antitoxin component of MazEF toxin-antitoxin module